MLSLLKNRGDSPLLWLPQAAGFAHQTGRRDLEESRAAIDEAGRLVVPKPRKRKYASYLGEISPAPENLINRDFQAAVPNEKWPTDITEFQIPADKAYLSPIIDCFFSSHRVQFETLETAFYVVNHAISQRLCAAIVQSPHDYFDIKAVAGLPTKGVAHIALRDGMHRLRFEDGFPIGPNLLEQRDGACDVVWFSRDRQLLESESGRGCVETLSALQYAEHCVARAPPASQAIQ